MATVTLDRLTKRFPDTDVAAADAVTVTIADGEFFALLGPSGCGKSTTLRMIADLETTSDGDFAIDGVRMTNVAAKDRDIAMVFQSYALYPHMSVFDNLAFGLRRCSLPRSEIGQRAGDVATILGLNAPLQRKPHALSGGQRQRVALGRAIVRQPKVFLFDEPLSNLDAALRVGMRGELTRLHRRLGTTMIYVTHDQVEAMTMGDRICIMQGGRVAQIGAPLEVYQQPANTFAASFLGSPPMNLLPATIGERTQIGALRRQHAAARGCAASRCATGRRARRAAGRSTRGPRRDRSPTCSAARVGHAGRTARRGNDPASEATGRGRRSARPRTTRGASRGRRSRRSQLRSRAHPLVRSNQHHAAIDAARGGPRDKKIVVADRFPRLCATGFRACGRIARYVDRLGS
ncbi:MAG: ATP-binding cassette domain-containing protein [Burkholderiaceae bacterium]|nr:ATP-binding cassette domain-containing protein [Burkholderiaceae bacterium]